MRLKLLLGALALMCVQQAYSNTPMGVYYQMEVSDPSAFVAAMSEFQNSETAKNRNATVSLREIISMEPIPRLIR